MSLLSEQKQTVSVLGAGSYGTALAFCLSRNCVDTLLWARSPSHVEAMSAQGENAAYLPGHAFPDSLGVTSSIEQAVNHSRDILLVVPSYALAETLTKIKPLITSEHRIVWATKGLEPDTGRLLHAVAMDILGNDNVFGVLSGPTFAKEMVAGLPTAITLSSPCEQFLADFSEKLHCTKSFRVYRNSDMVGVQLGGAVKNIIAIGAGLADGIGFGANARTALITRGLAEMSRLGCAMGADANTFMGMAGLGDLVLTCTDNQSRNRRFGLSLGQGNSIAQAQDAIGQVVEGYRNTKEVYLLAQREGVEMPIVEQIYQVLYQQKDAKEAAYALLGRTPREE
jgi:glycerol-3-phosphate dehydrogenase (NAD(P)+)